MSSSNKKETVRGKRYSPEEKSKIVAFVTDYNAANGRGGQSKASEKFGISQLTIATWLRKGGASTTKKSLNTGSMQNKLTAMIALGKDIDKLERDLSAKRKQFDALKAAL